MKNIIFIWWLGLTLCNSCNIGETGKNGGSAAVRQVLPDTAVNRTVNSKTPDNYIIDGTENQDNGPVYMYCDKMPVYRGGESAFVNFVRTNVKYPPAAVKDKIEGRVVVKFIIRETGKHSDLKVIRSVRPDLDNECLRVLREMPDWTPGMIDGKPVAVSFSIPIRFVLNNNGILSGFYILPGK